MNKIRTYFRQAAGGTGFQSLEKSDTFFSSHWKFAVCAAALLFGISLRSSAVVLASETFDSGTSGWIDRDPGEMTVSFSGAFGSPAGSLHGSFASQVLPSFQSDAFRAGPLSSGGDFTGNLYLSYTNFSDYTFAFYAEDVLPSSFIIRIGDGTNTFLYNLNPQLSTLATWTTIDVSLNYYAGWIGGTATQFSNLFSSVAFVDVQVGRNGTGVQDYFLDNFSLNFTETIAAAVPEPASIGLILMGVITLVTIRRRRKKRALTVSDEKQ